MMIKLQQENACAGHDTIIIIIIFPYCELSIFCRRETVVLAQPQNRLHVLLCVCFFFFLSDQAMIFACQINSKV